MCVFTTRRYTNIRLHYLYLTYACNVWNAHLLKHNYSCSWKGSASLCYAIYLMKRGWLVLILTLLNVDVSRQTSYCTTESCTILPRDPSIVTLTRPFSLAILVKPHFSPVLSHCCTENRLLYGPTIYRRATSKFSADASLNDFSPIIIWRPFFMYGTTLPQLNLYKPIYLTLCRCEPSFTSVWPVLYTYI